MKTDKTKRKMKIKRQKKVGRILSFFKNNYGHRPPFQVLIDGTFAQACLETKVNIKDQLPKYLGTVHILRKHFYSTKLNLTTHFSQKLIFFRQIKRISFSTLHFDKIFML